MVPAAHEVQGEQTVSDVGVHACDTYSLAPQVLQVEQTLSFVLLQAKLSKLLPAVHAPEQPLQTVSDMGVHACDTYSLAPQVLHVEHTASCVGVQGEDMNAPRGHVEVHGLHVVSALGPQGTAA